MIRHSETGFLYFQKILEGFLRTDSVDAAGTADDIAKGVLFPAADDSSYITGVGLPIDGGYYTK